MVAKSIASGRKDLVFARRVEMNSRDGRLGMANNMLPKKK